MNKILCASKYVSSFNVLYKSLEKYVGKPNCVSFSTFIEHSGPLTFSRVLFWCLFYLEGCLFCCDFLFVLYVYECLPAYLCVSCMPGALRSEKKKLDHLEKEFTDSCEPPCGC